jgi:hypothetical protein
MEEQLVIAVTRVWRSFFANQLAADKHGLIASDSLISSSLMHQDIIHRIILINTLFTEFLPSRQSV